MSPRRLSGRSRLLPPPGGEPPAAKTFFSFVWAACGSLVPGDAGLLTRSCRWEAWLFSVLGRLGLAANPPHRTGERERSLCSPRGHPCRQHPCVPAHLRKPKRWPSLPAAAALELPTHDAGPELAFYSGRFRGAHPRDAAGSGRCANGCSPAESGSSSGVLRHPRFGAAHSTPDGFSLLGGRSATAGLSVYSCRSRAHGQGQ